MARVQYGSLITDLKGSIGGITFQSNSANKIARLKPTRRKQNSTKQNSQISQFTQHIAPWQQLDAGEKTAWNSFAVAHTKTNKWGEVKTLTGFTWFASINNYLAIIADPPIINPPTWTPSICTSNYTVAAVFDDFSFNWAGPFNHASHYLLCFTSPLLRTVSEANRKTLRLTKIVSPGSTSAIDFLSEWQSTHGIAVPISGSPSKKFIFTAIQCVRELKGLVSVYNTGIGEYEPT